MLKRPEILSRRPTMKAILRALIYVLSALIIIALVLVAALVSSPVVTNVDLGYSTYKGTQSNGISSWRGMRYAAPPLGDLRFRAPRDPLNTTSVQDASQSGSICIATSVHTVDNKHSEDCLFVDVFAPTEASSRILPNKKNAELLPVYVFIQGGGFNSNSNSNLNGAGLINASGKNLVVVTFGYRVGPYGFLASKEVKGNGDINVGLKDQRKVFEWVQNHISKFGGNPKHVTIGGDSAGAASVDLHLSAYGGRDDGLFHAAAAESQSLGLQLTVEGSQYQYDGLVDRTGCNSTSDSLACLRKLPVEQLQAVNFNVRAPNSSLDTPLFMYSNVIDGDFTTDYTYKLFAEGKFIKVPVIFGADTNDGTVFAPRTINSVAALNRFLQTQFPKLNSTHLAKINAYFPIAEQFPNSGSYWRAAANAYGNMRYMCPGLFISSAYTNASTPSWNYRYNVLDPASVASGIGVSHTSEIAAIWGLENVPSGGPASYYTALNRNIIPVMMGYWTSFIRDYNPNTFRAQGAPLWGQWDQGRLVMEANTSHMEAIDTVVKSQCDYLSSIGVFLQQ